MKILFLCASNSARSPMAECLAREIFGDHATVISAGSKPSLIHPLAIQVMAEIGLDISHHKPKFLDSVDIEDVTHVITLCNEERCPYVLTKVIYGHWLIDDPATSCDDEEDQLEQFRQVRDILHQRILELSKRPLC
jgi:arsenate reductase (thioredoxin)